MPEPISTEAQASAAGLATPTNLDLLAQGDDAILRNARFTADALTAAAEAKAAAAAAGTAPIVNETVAFAVVDQDDRRTWLEAAPDGGPTAHAVSKLGPAVAGAAASAAGLTDQDTDTTGLAFAVVDEDGRRTWLEAAPDGRPTARAVALLADQLGDATPASFYQSTYSDALHRVASGPDIVCWGDSMTAGAGGGGTSYPSVLSQLTGRTVHNRGVGGETTVTIAARAGANPLQVIPEGGTIPASGPVALTLRPINGHIPAPLLQGTAGYTSGTLAGVPGTLSLSAGVYSFTRTAAGSAVTVNRPTPWKSSEAENRRGDIALVWVGQNGPDHARAKADAAAIIRHLSALDKRYLVLSRPTSTAAEDAEWHDIYGRRFVAARQYLNEYGLDDAGLTATPEDTTDIAAGRVPVSLRSDSIHFNAAGYTVLAGLLNNRLREMGWI